LLMLESITHKWKYAVHRRVVVMLLIMMLPLVRAFSREAFFKSTSVIILYGPGTVITCTRRIDAMLSIVYEFWLLR